MPRYAKREFQIGEYWLSQRRNSPAWCRTWYDKPTRQTRRVSLDTPDLEEAKQRLADWFVQHHKPKGANPDEEPIVAVLARYYEGHARKIASAEQAAIAISNLNGFFGNAPISALTEDRVKAYIESRPVSDGTIDRELSVLRAALRRSWKRGEIRSVPFIQGIETQPEPKGRPLEIEEMAAVFDAIREEHVWMFAQVATNTLCRPDANLDLTLFQCSFRHGLIQLNPEGRKQTKKHRPTVPMTDTLRPWLQAAPGPHIVQYRGKKIASIKTAVRRLRASAGLDKRFTAYSFRHTMARELRKRGVSKFDVGGFLGHRKRDTTDTYAPYDPRYLIDAKAAIDAYFRDLNQITKCSLLAPVGNALRANCVLAGK